MFDPPPFDPAKLQVRYLPGVAAEEPSLPWRRRYTLTHNDITGSLQLSVGLEYNYEQLAGWYTRILRDEVLAEWHTSAPSASGTQCVSLNVYCHVSGEEIWPAPPALRSFIFQREMRLVLDTIAYAERGLLAAHPTLASAPVYVHLVSDMDSLNRVISWGCLNDRSTWHRPSKGSVLTQLVAGLWRDLSNDEEPVSQGPVMGDGEKLNLEVLQTRAGKAKYGRTTSSVSGASPPTRRESALGPLPGRGRAAGRFGSKMVAVAAQRNDGVWPTEVNSSNSSQTNSSIARAVPAVESALVKDAASTQQKY